MVNLVQMVKSRKRLLFMVVIIYIVLMLVLYQGFKWKQLTIARQGSSMVLVDAAHLRESIRYMFNDDPHGNSSRDVVLDIHIEDADHGHTGELLSPGGSHDHSALNSTTRKIRVAIGGGITSKRMKDITPANIATKFQVFNTLLPSFCKTASSAYDYHFYFAYDKSDGFFSSEKLVAAFQGHFQKITGGICQQKDILTSVHFVQCSHTAKPAWAQNDAMMEAYLDNSDYYYRINDDSLLESRGWTEAFIKTLAEYEPPDVGVVGPHHHGGNMAILTYDFVHHTHIEVFGFYYPRTFTDWWADDWVTKVYQPGRSTKMAKILLRHTMKLGQRYKVNWSAGKKLAAQLAADRKTLARYIRHRTESKDRPAPDGTKVVSMSLYGSNPRYTMGAIRNAQILPVFYPGWSLRVYLAAAGANTHPKHLVPHRVVNKLKSLGAQLAYVNASEKMMSPKLWRYLVADDEKVEYFVVRNADARLSDRDFAAVSDWMTSQAAFHCMRDHPSHASQPVVDGLWGARTDGIRRLLPFEMGNILRHDLYKISHQVPGSISASANFSILASLIWPLVQESVQCHDAVSCDKWTNAKHFPTQRVGLSFVGEQFDPFQRPLNDGDQKKLQGVKTPSTCLGKGPAQLKTSPTPSSANAAPNNSQLHQNDSRTKTGTVPVTPTGSSKEPSGRKQHAGDGAGEKGTSTHGTLTNAKDSNKGTNETKANDHHDKDHESEMENKESASKQENNKSTPTHSDS